MELNLTQKQFRRLLDLVYIGNWVLNSTRGDDRIREYDEVMERMDTYLGEFEQHGTDNITVDMD